MKPLCLLYFGADASWKRLEKSGFSRRNTNLLKAFSEHPEVGLVVNVQFHTRRQWIQSWWPGQKSAPSALPKVIDFGVVAFFPSLLPGGEHLNRLLNSFRIKRTIGGTNRQVISWCYGGSVTQTTGSVGKVRQATCKCSYALGSGRWIAVC